jgi:hypothetical protein
MRAGCITQNIAATQTFGTRGIGTSTARLKSGAAKPWGRNHRRRAETRRHPPPLRYGAAPLCIVSHTLKLGRDVGLAKSGFRPTSPKKIQPPVSAGYEGLLFPPEQSEKIFVPTVPQISGDFK